MARLQGTGHFYNTALANGWPIATGAVEGACRHLTADRLDITGALWGLPGAEAVLRLRAVVANGDLDLYWHFHTRQEHQRIYLEPCPQKSASLLDQCRPSKRTAPSSVRPAQGGTERTLVQALCRNPTASQPAPHAPRPPPLHARCTNGHRSATGGP